jgi:hypothetical protein
LAGVAKLFLTTSEDTSLADSTQEIYRKAPEPKEMVALSHGRYAGLVDDEKRDYENRMVSFFLTNLPLDAPAPPPTAAAPTVTPTPTAASSSK